MVGGTSPAGDVDVKLLFVTWHPLPARHGNWCGRLSLTATIVYGGTWGTSSCFKFPAMPNDKLTIVDFVPKTTPHIQPKGSSGLTPRQARRESTAFTNNTSMSSQSYHRCLI